MIEKFVNYINDKNKAYVIFDIGSRDCQQSIEFYKTFPNAKIYAFECNPNTLDLCEQNIIPYQDRITLIKGAVCGYDGDIDICYINNNYLKFTEDKIALNRVKLLVNSSKILFNNLNSNLEMFCTYHKKYYFREDNFYFTFFGVNEVYSKEKTCNNVLEYELDKYNPFLQKRGYMETSVYLHVYWNKLYKNKDMIGFSQYDMKHNKIYNNLDKKTIYLLNQNRPIVKNGKWNSLMFPKIRNLDFLIKSYNAHFNKKYTMKELENKPLSLWQTNIYPVKIYEKLCGWLEKLVDEIYPWSNQPPYETHFGSIGGYTERALSIFNAFEIFEGISYSNLNIQHGVGAEVKEQYNHKSFLNNYSQDVHCKIVEEVDNTKDYSIVGIDNQNDSIIKKNINGITQLFYLDEQGNRSKPLMVIGNNSDNTFKWKHNILDCNLDDYEIYYKKIDYYRYDIILQHKITCFSYSNNNKVYDITFPTIKAYCEEHNYQFIPYHTNLENKYKPHWNKLHYSIKLLKETNSEYIVWFDHDIVIKNYNIKLQDIITRYKFDESNSLFMMSQDPASHHPFNTGVIVFKNKKETLHVFQEFLEMRNNPHKYPLLNKYGGFNFNSGMQDTRVMLAYFHQNKDNLLSIPHKVLQSFFGQAEFYSTGDLCGHVAGPQGERLISKLKELKNYENFDIVIPVGPNDKSVIEQQIKYTQKNIIGYRNIYLICYDSSIIINGCITIDENIFPFNIETVARYHGKLERNGWYLQQLLKLYAGKIVPDILDKYLVIDSDTFFLKPTTFVKNNRCLYNYGTEYHKPYFHHMKKMDRNLTRIYRNKSGICHHMIFEKKYIDELISKIEKNHNELFYHVFLKTVTDKSGSGASEYEIYFNYMLKYNHDKIQIRKLSWKNANKLETNSNYDYISYHWHMR